MEVNRSAAVHVATEEKELNVSFILGWTAEDVCIKICRIIGIGPVARHLFALRNRSTKLWYSPNHKFKDKEKRKFDFRLRFKPSSLQRLKQIDKKAYDYYFQQARSDVMDNNVPDIVYERHKRELIGLGVSDMYRVMLEKQVPREIVESDYKKYIPKECIKRHAFFIKKPIHDALSRISGHDASYVKEQYLKQFECMAPNYPYEECKALMDKGVPNPPSKVILRVNVSEVKYCETETGAWNRLCAIEDLCFVSIRQDNTVEISRKNGIPSYLKFGTNALLISFVSALDGYYRLSIKWTFNLCREVVTPSLERLHKLKCHGPVGASFSYGKLEEKRGKQPGTYIIRESEVEYNVYYFDVCGKDGKFVSQRIKENGPDDFVTDDSHEYKSLGHFVTSFQDPDGALCLAECLPPSEYDKSPLLICADETIGNDVAADEEIITSLLETGPRCVPRGQLQICKPFSKNDEGSNRLSTTKLYQGMWRVAKGKKLEVAIKILKEEEWSCTKDFLELTGKWGQLRSSALVRLYGVTLAPPIGMLLELVKLGPLDTYLRETSPQTIKTVDMIEATACLATALWHLEENGVIHGNIRCKKLLVHVHTDNSFIVKLTDPGLFIYAETDVHWLPPEFYNNPELAKHSFQTDIWAVATTIWQIFSRGVLPPASHDINIVRKYYETGKHLPIPNGCPVEVYKLMVECWGISTESRKQPQAIMRDINQILYQVYNSRRTHAYATAFPKLFSDSEHIDEDNKITEKSELSNSDSCASSLFTDHTSLAWDDIDEATRDLTPANKTYASSSEELSIYMGWLTDNNGEIDRCNAQTVTDGLNSTDPSSCALRVLHGNRLGDVRISGNNVTNGVTNNCGPGGSSAEGLGQMQGIFELDADCNVILQGRIGQGFYGEVYRGTLERDNAKDIESQQVAVKKLKTRAIEADLRDFEREISIMKTLKHPNVVEILGVISEPEVCLIMEFVKHGSLQSYLAIHRQTLTHKKLLGFALDIATGMDYLGHKSIVHRDLAARNILVADENHVKISDFGLAQVTGKNDYYILQTNRDLPIKWYAPESLRDGKFSPRSDVWSFGVTMYETFGLGEDPKLPGIGVRSAKADGQNLNQSGTELEEEGSAELLAALERGRRLPCPSTCPQIVYIKLMYPCWHMQSHERPDFATLCQDIRELLSQY